MLVAIGSVQANESTVDKAVEIIKIVTPVAVQFNEKLSLVKFADMLGDFTNETLLVKKVNMDCLIWGGTVIPLLNCVQDKLNETMPSRKKKKNKIAPEIEELTKQLWFPLRDAIKTLTD